MAIEDLYSARDSESYRDSLQAEAPWSKNPQCFKKVKIAALPFLKMAIHAESGGDIEVMGLMQGKVIGDTFYVMDSFRLPVQGTETRVNAGAEADEFMIRWTETSEHMLSNDWVIGWYHSHPGYGCWLSGIDVQTQALYQQTQEPFLAVVIDPKRSVAKKTVEIGAFRTLPKGSGGRSTPAGVPADKLKDFGAHANEYYGLEVEVFKTEFDDQMLQSVETNTNWVDILSEPALDRERMEQDIEAITRDLSAIDGIISHFPEGSTAHSRSGDELRSCTDRACKVAHEALYDLAQRMVQRLVLIKDSSDSTDIAM